MCIDLDGTLVRTDTLVETFIMALKEFTTILRLPLWLWQGKAVFKEKLALHTKVDFKLLPYNRTLLEYLQHQKSSGRYLVLATAANWKIAQEVNRHLNLFDEIIASDSSRNLRGPQKAKALVDRFGDRGFCYIGNDRHDLAVWQCASSGSLVNVSDRVAKKAANLTEIENRFTERAGRGIPLLKLIRPLQWSKNLLVFVPIITSGAIYDSHAILRAFLMFIAFCCIASATYIINDLYDLDADRQHPDKRRRPLASGDLSPSVALAILPVLILAGVSFARLVPTTSTFLLLVSYALLSTAYSIKLKQFPLVDVFTLAALYTIRVFAGGEATGYHVSFWLLAFSGFIFLALAIVKRTSELDGLAKRGKQNAARRGYTTADLRVLSVFGVSSSFISSLVVALYINDRTAKESYAHPQMLWFMVPLILLWQCRLWLSTSRGYMTDDPIVYAAKDWVSWFIVFMSGIFLLAARM
jgi:4-hydroxybenzoate polyprenyltransferase